jgi:formylglycine-generating enzyme required for sulfatase activity
VLAAFGHAFDRLPERRDELTPDQARFIEQSVGELSQDGRVVPVRLSLFAELMKTRAWTPATLVEVGGTEGVGVRFLEESFTSRAAVPETRALEKHARAVLLTLLPEAGAEIKGQMRSRAELAAGCGLPADSQQLARLLEILDRELHIVTPVEPLESVGAAGERAAATSPASRDEQSFYQLTHDYLVPPLRQWLLLERRKSWRGRAEICLEERAGQMSRWPQSRYLPSLREFFAILLAVPGSRQKPDERALMYAARRHFVTRGVALLLVVASVGGIAGTTWRNYVTSQREHYATDLVARLLVADSDRAAEIIRDARTQGAALAEAVRKALARDDLTPTQRLHLSLTVRAIDPRQDAYVRERILAATPKELELLRAELQPSGPELLEFLVQTLRNRGSPQDHRLRAACILAAIDANHEAWRDAATDVAAELVSQDPLSAHQWVQLLRPARKWLAPVLEEVHFGSEQRRDSLVAAMALAEYAGDDLPGLLKLLDRANDEQIAVLARRVGSIGPSGAAALSNKATILAPSATTSDERETAARQQARAAAALLHVAPDAELAWAAFRHGPDPTARSWLIQLTAASGVPVERIIRRLSTEPDESGRRALIHVLGRYRDESLPPAAREQLINHLLKLYSDYADPGVHFSAQWLLRTWGQQHRMDEIDMAATSGAPVDSRRWYRTKSGHEMVLIPTPITFFMGSPASERGRHTSEKLPQPMEIAYRFAVAAKEVTIEQYRLFMPEHRAGVARSSDWPVTQVSLYDAARFCNWLSEQEGLPPEQMCYEMNDAERAHLVPAFQSRRGFRLPLLHEAECAARSGTVTSRHFGSSDELLVYYDRFLENSSLQPAPVGSYLPNDFGLFDTLGNVAEWSHGPDETVPQRGYRRGGSYNLPSEWLRSAQVVGFRSDGPSDSVGFRVVQGWP